MNPIIQQPKAPRFICPPWQKTQPGAAIIVSAVSFNPVTMEPSPSTQPSLGTDHESKFKHITSAAIPCKSTALSPSATSSSMVFSLALPIPSAVMSPV
ncbi:hypothetical protein MJO28_013116 [Puccinia striiformis f. sp. tritici]|uniref:Uncharacterized protein n=1 Tax=Puccinia striiformis f. sp. tritici TaxID=168172 RepID=A0ACC0DXU8_9BASI|nr:hypothetical protein MJO28_013116 [Puccinia striiformis f. sp. tritici]